jgi:hypothetical protein
MGYGKTYKTKWLEDLSGNQGTANQVLISTSSGIAWATASTIIGGPYLPLSGGTMTGNTTHGDNVRSLYGASSDMQIYHDGSNSYVRDVGTGRLWIDSNGQGVSIISDGSGSTPMAHFYKDGAVELYHNNVRRFRTNDLGGVSIDHTSGSLGNSFFGGVSGASNGFQIANSSSNEITYTFQNGSNSQVLKILNNGNVGIGTTSPDEKLRVDGNIKSAGDFIGAALKLGFAGSANITTNDTNEDLLINPNGSGDILMHTTSTGNVGIGTSSPIAKLEVDGDIHPASNVSYSLGSSAKSFLFTNTYAVSSAGNLQLLAGGSEAMRIISSGNVGIGTTSPLAKTHISASGNLAIPGLDATLGTATSLAIGNNGGTVVLAAGVSNTNVSWLQGRQGTGTGNAFNISLNPLGGNVGIGTASPSANLDIEDSSGVTVDINSTSGDGLFRFQSAGTTKWSMGRDNTQQNFVIANSSGLGVSNVLTLAHSTGNVGIGTTSPGTALQVGGLDDGSNYDITLGWNAVSSQAVGTKRSALTFKTSQTAVNNEDIYKWDIAMVTAPATASNEPFGSNLAFLRSTRSSTSVDETTMILTQSGNVGIGVTNPQDFNTEANNLVIGTGSGAEGMTIYGGSSGGSYIYFADGTSGSALYEGFLQYRHSERAMRFGVGTGVKMTLDVNGRLGIGTTNPKGKLEIQRSQVTTQFDRDCFLRLHPTATTNSGGFTNMMFGTSATNNYGVAIGGKKAGTGDTSSNNNPEFSVRILNDSITGTEVLNINTAGNATFSGDVSLADNKKITFGAAPDFEIYHNSTTNVNHISSLLGRQLSISSDATIFSGNVGIGTTAPSEKLEVNGIIKAVHTDNTYAKLKGTGLYFNRSNVYIAPEGDNVSALNVGLNGQRWSQLKLNADTFTISRAAVEFMRVTSSGNVGIGTTSPSEKLGVVGNANVLGKFAVGISAAHPSLDFYNNGTAYFNGSTTVDDNFFVTNGNVGVGTASPNASSLLDVSSTTKGVLLPRMTTTQVNAISSPANGLTVYNTTLNTLCFYNGTSWQKVTSANM